MEELKDERVWVPDTIKPSSNPGLLSFRLISERKINYLLVWERHLLFEWAGLILYLTNVFVK